MKCRVPRRNVLYLGLPLSLAMAFPALVDAQQHSHGSQPAAENAPILFDNLGTWRRAVATSSPEAQKFFDQGLRLVYAFNHDEATRSFREAARLDPKCAMAYWGIALAAGPNINLPIDSDRQKLAHEMSGKALSLAREIAPVDRALIEALTKRYADPSGGDRQAQDQAYTDAMRQVVKTFPDDLDAATLFAESILDLDPWNQWTADGKPNPGTEEAVSTLESVLKREPNHPGANHYYIHAVEGSQDPGRATASAGRLETLVPGAGHLVHMPAHIYMRTGRYEDAAQANRNAVKADQEYFVKAKPEGVYPLMYYTHNFQFLWAAAAMGGRSRESLDAAREAVKAVPPEAVREMRMAEGLVPLPLFALARFGKWDEILAQPAFPDDYQYSNGMRHYARGMALSAKGRTDHAAEELNELDDLAGAVPKDQIVIDVNTASNLLHLASVVLAGEIAAKKGKHEEAILLFRKGASMEDRLRYTEPPAWYQPVRQLLGAVLLDKGQAAEAEKVFREDLKMNPDNGWALFGLSKALRAQGKGAEAGREEERFKAAWAHADVQLTAPRF